MQVLDHQYSSGEQWLGGPSHHVQRQHIPGYKGHVAGMQAENLFGHPFAKLSAESLNLLYIKSSDYYFTVEIRKKRVNGKLAKGFIIDEKERFNTIAGLSYVHPKGPAQFSNTLKQTGFNVLSSPKSTLPKLPPKEEDLEIPPIDRVPVAGYQGYRPTYPIAS